MAESLSKRQSDVLYYLRTHIRQTSLPPTLHQICNEFGFRSTNAAYEILTALERKGYITRQKGSSRAIQLIEKVGTPSSTSRSSATEKLPNTIKLCPIIGDGDASNPMSVFLSQQGSTYIDMTLFNAPKNPQFFCCIAPDSSMGESGIRVGDVLIVHQTTSPKNNDIVVALLNDTTIVRHYRRKDSTIELTAKSSSKITVQEGDTSVAILGTVHGLIRTLP